MRKAFFAALYMLPTAVIAHPGSGMVHDSQHLLWLLAIAAVAVIGLSCKKFRE